MEDKIPFWDSAYFQVLKALTVGFRESNLDVFLNGEVFLNKLPRVQSGINTYPTNEG